MIRHKRPFFLGLGLMIGFLVVLVVFFSPVFQGRNGLDYLDDLFNSISKGSAYFIPDLREDVSQLSLATLSMQLAYEDGAQAEKAEALFRRAGAQVLVGDNQLTVSGDLGQMLQVCLEDADAMYHNQGQQLVERYGFKEKEVLHVWWTSANLMEKSLLKQEHFAAAKQVSTINSKAVETSYNYYGIEAQRIADRWGVVLLSLGFYVIYTIWYGFAIMYLFEGFGLQLGH